MRRFKLAQAFGAALEPVAGGPSPHDGAQLGAVLDPVNTASADWADTVHRAAANIEMPQKRGLKPRFQRPKPRGKPMPHPLARGNATGVRVRSRVGRLCAAGKCRFDLVIRTVGKAPELAARTPAGSDPTA